MYYQTTSGEHLVFKSSFCKTSTEMFVVLQSQKLIHANNCEDVTSMARFTAYALFWSMRTILLPLCLVGPVRPQ